MCRKSVYLHCMTPFLKQVARHYMQLAGEISRLCFVFPNRRALRFFEHYLGSEIAATGKGPVVSPQLYTINDFFYAAAGARVTGRIPLLLELYACYSELNPHHEPLDDFIFWGDTLLGDFDDVDKYLVQPEHLFTNVSEFKEMQGDWSWLTEAQREAIERFTSHFEKNGSIKEGFLSIWRILLPLYSRFNEALTEKGLWYEGKVYRTLCDRLEEAPAADIMAARFPWSKRFVFVGLNALNECERTVLRKLQSAGLAEFCWDWRSDMIRDRDNKSSVFLRDFTVEFPAAFTPDPEGLPETEFFTLSVPGSIIQAKQLPEILSRCTPTPGIETAVVLPDEQMLIPVLNSIPEHITKMNVTMGYPISGSQMWSLITELGALQMHIRQRNGETLFYHRQVWALASNSIIKSVLSEEGAKALEEMRKERQFYVSQASLQASDPVLAAVFRPVVHTVEADAGQIEEICEWMQGVLVAVAPRLKEQPDMQLELDFAKVCHETLESLRRYGLKLQPVSFFRLLAQLTAGVTVPFTGEPLEGMQIMGPLELRAMDFDNLIILGCNEGVFPRRSVSSSFIPPELRKGFGLPTYEYQDAVWAYYFYRAIQRASRVWMVYDSSAEGLKGGEASRYIKQLEMHFKVPVKHYESSALLGAMPDETVLEKTAEDIEKLKSGHLSASALKNYNRCPAMLYYSKVCGLTPEKDVQESLDAGMLGNVLHKTMQTLYPPETVLSLEFIDRLLKDKARIRSIVDENIRLQLNAFEVSGRNLVYSEVVCNYVDIILRTDRLQVEESGPIRILGTEKCVSRTILGFPFIGYIDRLDSSALGSCRVVDYKSGKVTAEDLEFSPKTGDLPEIGLQLYMYKLLLAYGGQVSGAIYHPASLISGKPLIQHSLDDSFCEAMQNEVERILEEISDLSLPWLRTSDIRKCKYCDFRAICGR